MTCLTGTIFCLALLLLVLCAEMNFAIPLTKTSATAVSDVRFSQIFLPFVLLIESFASFNQLPHHFENSAENDDELFYSVSSKGMKNDIIDVEFRPVVVCNAGKDSGWLYCQDSTGVSANPPIPTFTIVLTDI